MTKLLLTTALLAFLAVPAMADNGGPGVSGGGGGINNAVTSSYGDGGYVHKNDWMVEEWEARIARLQYKLSECQGGTGSCTYGNSTVALESAIRKSQRQLGYWLAERAAGRNHPVGSKIPNNAPIQPCNGSIYC